MKTAVVSVAIGPYHQGLAETSFPCMEEYAKRIGADFVPIREPSVSSSAPGFERFCLFRLLNDYGRIIYFDADLLVRSDCPDLFSTVPEGEIGLFNEGAFTDHLEDMRRVVKQCSLGVPKWSREWYNCGVMVVSRQHKFVFEPPDHDMLSTGPSALINLRLARQGKETKVFELPYRLNRMSCVDRITGEHRLDAHVVHYSGINRDMESSLIKKDLENWRSMAPRYDYKRNIFIKVHGGLGDEVCAEPVIRFISEKCYPDSNVVIATWFPRLFVHLPVTVLEIDGKPPACDSAYYVMETMAPPEHPSWQFMSANLMHTTDFISQICLRQILSDEDRQIKLAVQMEDVAEALDVFGIRPLNELVLVHPGKGWPSKSFPPKYWNQIINGLSEDGHAVAVVGKHISDDQGTMDLEIPKGVMDARDLLGLGALMATISQAKILVTNDSAPVHVAGAFDNWIILIPTCKHPDHVLPMRQGSRRHKTVALYKKLTCELLESLPTQIHGKTIDKVKGDLMEYLPDPTQVIETVRKISRDGAP